jgi:hypothetical protein
MIRRFSPRLEPLESRLLLSANPTLAITAFTAPPTATLGAPITLNWSVANTSTNAATGSWSDNVYVSSNATFDTTAQLTASFPAPLAAGLAAGASYSQSEQVALPDTPTGSRYLFLVADAGDTQPVTNVGPITASSGITLAAPDLQVSLTAPSSAVLGQAFNVSWTVTNQGSGDTVATSWADDVYADTGAMLDSSAVLLGSYVHYGLLNPGDSYSQSQAVTLPIDLSGPYNLFVVTNSPLPL